MVLLVLDDGSAFWQSSLVGGGVFTLIAEAMDESQPQLKRWLHDKGGRPNPFMDLDMRSLSPEHRAEFHRAARVAYERLAAQVRDEQMQTAILEPLADLRGMFEAIERGEQLSGEKVAFDPLPPEDMDEVWEA